MYKRAPQDPGVAPAVTVRVPTAVEMLGLGRSKFYELIDEGEIETIKVGRTTLVVVESIHAFVASKRRTAGHA